MHTNQCIQTRDPVSSLGLRVWGLDVEGSLGVGPWKLVIPFRVFRWLSGTLSPNPVNQDGLLSRQSRQSITVFT
jgi:hypothetical protein